MSAVYRLTTSLDACLQCGVQWNLCLALKTALVALRAFETLAPLSERCIVHILHRAAHIPWALLWDVAFIRQGSVPRVCGIVQKVEKAFVVFFQSCLSAVFVLILRGEEGTIRVAEVGSLLAKAKMPSILSSGVYLQIHGNLVLHILEIKFKGLNIIIKWRVPGLKYL